MNNWINKNRWASSTQLTLASLNRMFEKKIPTIFFYYLENDKAHLSALEEFRKFASLQKKLKDKFWFMYTSSWHIVFDFIGADINIQQGENPVIQLVDYEG